MARNAPDFYHPRYSDDRPPRPPPAATEAMYQFGRGRPPRGRGDFSFRSTIADRELLRHIPTGSEDQLFVSHQDGERFRDVENLTDSDEADMEEESDVDDNNRAKRRKIEQLDGSAESKAKWSNPDPYTALPPPPDTTGTRVDVVKLIRKARNEAQLQETVAEPDDFISFDTLGDDQFAPPSDAPAGPKAKNATRKAHDTGASQALGKRKRSEYDGDTLITGPRGISFYANGAVLDAWRAGPGVSPTPWLNRSSPTDTPISALHKEILHFHEWVKPHEYERSVRQDLMNRLEKVLKRFRSGTRLKSFGSYAAGLYLPTGDMDVVAFLPGLGENMAVSKTQMYNASRHIERDGIARRHTMLVIAHAKVPIIKFVDDLTGLKVDLSFNNTTGVVANDTFRNWQALHPAMPVLVAIVKQFLMIRGLNDNSVGGIGGFASICMVTSLIQNMPTTRNPNLGELLVEFFNLFGNLLDIQSVGIRMDPPGFVDKYTYSPIRDERANRLMIIDPNRPDNNITGGSHEVLRILDLFRRTHETLLERLDDFADGRQQPQDFSFLADLVGGDFNAYHEQRRALHAVYSRTFGGSDPPPPPPPPPQQASVPPPPPPSSRRMNGAVKQIPQTPTEDESASDTQSVGGKSLKKGQKRLNRVKRLCPELSSKLAGLNSLARHKALKIGGWKDLQTMSKDLDYREKSQGKGGKTNGKM